METTLSQFTNLVSNFMEEQAAYAVRSTKASSKRLRSLSQQLNKLGPALRKELVAKDKE